MSSRRIAIALAIAALIGVSLWLLLRPRAPLPGQLGSVDVSQPSHPSPDASSTGSLLARPDGATAEASANPGALRVRGSWGAGAGQFGRKGDPEGATEGPMSLRVDARGNLWVLDQVNRRVQRYSADGKPLPAIAIGGDTAQDLAIGKDDRLIVLDRLGEANVQLWDRDGKSIGEVPLVGKGIPEGGGVTGLFTDRDGNVLVEREHRSLFKIADAEGHSLPERPSVPGRPRRDGGAWLNAAIADRGSGAVTVKALDSAARTLWEVRLELGAPLLRIVLLDSDSAGNSYLAGETGRESTTPPYRIVDLQLAIVALEPGGKERGRLNLPSLPTAEENFRTLTVADDGTLYRMRATPEGIVIESFRL